MSFIVRIVVVCLLLSAFFCIAAASDGEDRDHGHDSGEASGSDHSDGDSSGEGDGGRDSGGHDRDSSHEGYSGSPGGEDGHDSGEASGSDSAGESTEAHDSDSSYEGYSGSFSGEGEHRHDGGAHDGASSDSEEDAPATNGPDEVDNHHSDSGSADTAGEDRTRASRDSGGMAADRGDDELSDNRETPGHEDRWDARDHNAERPDPETPDSKVREDGDDGEDGRDVDKARTVNGGELDTRVIYTGSYSPPSGDNDRADEKPDDASDDAARFAREQPINHQTGPEAHHRPAPPLPAQVPNGEVPFASTPALPASGLPLSSPTGTSTGTVIPARSKIKGEHEPFWEPTDSALVMSPWMLLKLWCFLGFRRVLKKNVLESDERRSLYESITMHPGVDLAKLTEMLRLNKETARYHLKMLAATGKISGLIKQGIARYFPCREMISEFEKTVIHYLWIGTTKQILLLLIRTPGLTRQAIAQELGIAGPSVTWQMQRLAEDGLVEMRAEGRFVRYFLTPVSVDVLESVKRADGRIGPVF